MSIVDWAHVVLPLAALVGGVYLAWRHAEVIDRCVAELDRFWSR